MANESFRILGRVIDQSRKAVPGLRVEAWDKERIYAEAAGSASTDKDGAFRIELDEPSLRSMFKDRRPDLFFKLLRGKKLVKSTEREISRKVVIGETRVLIQCEVDAASILAIPEEEAPPPPPEPPKVEPPPPPVVEKIVERLVLQPAPAPVEKKRPRVPAGGLEAAAPQPSSHVQLHSLSGQVVDATSGKPLAGLMVRAYDLDEGPEPRQLGGERTGGRGQFTVGLTLPRGQAPLGRRLRAVVFDGAREVVRHEWQFDETSEIRLHVSLPPAEVAVSPRLEELQFQAQLYLPPAVLSFLGRRGVYTLHDVRAAGGVAHLQGLPVQGDAEPVRALEAHASLELLTSDARTSGYLIQQGYGSIRAIAETNSAQFVRGTRDTLGELGAAQLHARARAQTDFLNDVLAWVSSGGAHPLSAIQALPASPEPRPEDSALSHAAYLAELLDLARRHLTDSGKAVGLTAIAAKLHQPIAELPAGGAAVERKVKQARIAVEALRSRHGSESGGAVDGEEAYREAAYHALLDQIGTSHDELRRVRSAPPFAGTVDRRRALAERLGLDGVERLDKLFIDLDRPRALSEKLLEELFGLRDTTRPAIAVTEGEDSDPEILKWRLARLKARWKEQDRPRTAFDSGARPIIDPDVLTLADLRQPQPGQSPYILYTARRNWVDSARDKLVASRDFAWAVDNVLGKIDFARLSAALDQDHVATLRELEREHDLSAEAFRQLAALAPRAEQLTDEEWQEVCVILTQVKKVRQFAAWVQEEQGTVALGPAQFMPLHRPARELTRWLASAEARATYEEALERRSEGPIIDPDLLGAGDFVRPAAGNAAWDLYSARRERVEKQLAAWRAQIGNQSGKIDSLIGGALTLGGGELAELAQRYRHGDDLSARLAELSLPADAFARLVALRDHLSVTTTPLDAEWDELYALLAQAWKRRQFADWRDEEEAQGVVLGPELFRGDENPQVEIPAWRGSYGARRRWQEALGGRIAEDLAVRAGVEAAVSACEELTLPLLRDAFIDASSDSGDREEKTRRLTAELHLDLGRAGSETTTRVGQAIESLQSLLSVARSPDASLDGRRIESDASFDEEWRWVSSYDAWRAARFAFLHPENLLAPELRRRDRQSPAFRALQAQLEERVTAESASRAADGFADYFRDVGSLTVEASCLAPTRPHKLELRHRTQAESDVPILYLFARSKTDAVYFSACNQKDPTGYGQGFWQAVPGLSRAGKILGAVPYFPSEEQHFLLLFAQVSAAGGPRLSVTSYDLHEERWSGEVTELDLPARGVFSAAVEQRDNWSRPPRVVISLRGATGARAADVDLEGYGLLYTRRLNRAGNGWQSRDFRLLLADETTDAVFALSQRDDTNVVVYGSTGNLRVGVFAEGGEAELERVSTLGAGLWLGALAVSGELFAVVRRDSGAVFSGAIPVDKIGAGPILLENAEPPSLLSVAVHSGRETSVEEAGGRDVVYQSRSGAWCGRLIVRDGRLMETAAQSVAPRIDGPFDVPAQLSETDLALRALKLRAAFAETRGLSNLVYLEEAYYYVPTLIALRLHAAGQYAAALDWYRTVYDYTSGRPIYPGFTQDAQSGFRRASDWLLDPLNPHAVAETRGGAHLRFTLMSLSRCLCDWADAEFARGGSEALARARQLYGRAGELLADKQLDLQLDRGERAVAELDALVAPDWRSSFSPARADLLAIRDGGARREAADEVRGALKAHDSWDARIERARLLARRARDNQAVASSYHDVVGRRAADTAQVDHALLGQPEVAEALRHLGEAAGADFLHGVAAVTGAAVAQLQSGKIELGWLAGISAPVQEAPPPPPPRRRGEPAYAAASGGTPVAPIRERRETTLSPLASLSGLRKLTPKYVPALSPRFAPEPNPLLASLKLRVQLQLDQLRGGRTIAGDRRAPASHSFDELWRRAGELARLGREIEGALTAADELRAAGEYSLLLARQHLGLLDRVAQLEGRHAHAAELEVASSLEHAGKARLSAEALGRLLDEGTRALEHASLLLASRAAPAGVDAPLPGYDERAAEWEDDRAEALHEWRLASSETGAARETASLRARAERVAALHALQAAVGAELLGGRFGDRELHGWVASALERSKRFCLSRAAAAAQLAEAVVAFEENSDASPLVRAEYLHGAELSEDLERLGRRRAGDGHALSLEKTLSLVQLAPEAVARLQETGVLSVRTPLALFDRDTAGHYQRRVRRVGVSLVTRAAVPPIHATLTASRASRVVVRDGAAFREVTLLGGPDEVVLSSPGGGPGEVWLTQAGAIAGNHAPFSGIGLDTTWELSLPRAAHPFDFTAIVDVRLAIGYSALVSEAYRQQVSQSLQAARRASRPFSLRAQFAESWYDLHNPELAATPMSVRFLTRREDFPPNLEALTIEDVALRVVPVNGEAIEMEHVELRYAPHGTAGGVGGHARSVDGVISSRHTSGGGWGALRGLPPVGEWQLTLPDDARARFRGDQIADLLFVVSYAGQPSRR